MLNSVKLWKKWSRRRVDTDRWMADTGWSAWNTWKTRKSTRRVEGTCSTEIERKE
jgi:hypothetical protein